jgi:thiamine pyrophosphokinase
MLAEGTCFSNQPSSAPEDFSLRRNVQRIVIFANGELPDLEKAHRLLRPADYVICADGGTRHALALGIQPDLVIGDLDSADQEQLQVLLASVPIERFPHDKNETDLELAINRAVGLKPDRILILGALGGRLDQTLGNITLLTDPRLAALDVKLDDGLEQAFICHEEVQVHGRGGDLVSLIPWGGPVSGIQTVGLKWPLANETLYPDKTRGISNEMLGNTASISIGSGLLLVVHRRQTSPESNGRS